MKGIHITFPVVVCKDILRRQQQLFYEASISTGAKQFKGSICARQIWGPNGNELIDIIIQFPSRNKASYFVKGKLHCQIDEVKEKKPFDSDLTVRATDDASRDAKTAAKISRLKPAKEGRKTILNTPISRAISETRPCRHREKPAKFKDYDTELDFIRSDGQKHAIEGNRELVEEAIKDTNTAEFENELSERTEEGSRSGETRKRGRKRRMYISSNSVGLKKRKTYDKLIKHLTQASAKEGYEIQSVLCSLKSSIYRDQKGPLLMSEEEPGQNINALETHTDGDAKSEIVSRESLLSSMKSELITKKVRGTSHSQFKSFPRKFPSSLRSSFKPCQDLQLVEQTPQFSDEILNKYRIICSSAGGVEHEDDDTSNLDYTPEKIDKLDVEKNKKKRISMCHAQKIKLFKNSNSAEEEGDKLLDKFQVLHASGVKVGDQFFIPQTTYVKDGKMNTVLTGPFRLLESGHQSDLEIVPEDERDDMPKVLYGDLHLPHSTVWGLEGTGTKVVMHILSTAALSVTLDHDYIKGRQDTFDVPKIPRTFLKPIRMAQHISARVEKVEEGEGKSLVTISGCNNKAKSDAGSLRFTTRLNAEGIPIADSLEDVMTDRIRRVQKERESYQQALEAKPTAPEIIGVNELQVSGEVTLKAWGHIQSNQLGSRRNWARGRPRKHLPLSTFMHQGVMKLDHERADIDEKNIIMTLQDIGSNSVVVNMQSDVSLGGENDDDKNHGDESLFVGNFSKQKENYIDQGIIGANFRPGEVIEIDDKKGTLFTEPKMDMEDVIVPAKNDTESVSLLQSMTLKICNYCLRLFPESGFLYRHVKNDHSVFFKDAGYQQYLEDLRLEKPFICPFCPERCSMSNEYRFRTHLAQIHNIKMKEQHCVGWPCLLTSLECEICHVYFQSRNELEVHAMHEHDSQPLLCPHCTDAFLLDSTLGQHLRQVHGEGQKPELSTEEKVQKTSTQHHLFCGTSQIKMNLHKRLRHNLTDANLQHCRASLRSHSCTYCKKFFKTAGSLSRHIEVNHTSIELEEGRRRSRMTDESLFQCTLCLEQFVSEWDVEQHNRCVHAGSMPVHCIFCAAECTSVTSMYAHIDECHLLTDAHIDPVQSQKVLAQHAISIHGYEDGETSGLAPSRNLDEVSDGERTESSVQNLQCPYCVDVFSRTSLVAHIVGDHRDHFPHTCLHCEQTFLTKEGLQCHTESAHDQGITVQVLDFPFQSLVTSNQSSEMLPKDITVTSNQTFSPITNHQGIPSILDSQSALSVKPALIEHLPELGEKIIWCVDKQGIQTMVRSYTGDAVVQQQAACPQNSYELRSHLNNLVGESSCGVQCVEIVTDRIAVGTDVIADAESEHVYGMELSMTDDPVSVSFNHPTSSTIIVDSCDDYVATEVVSDNSYSS